MRNESHFVRPTSISPNKRVCQKVLEDIMLLFPSQYWYKNPNIH